MSMYARQVENHIEREVAEAINERDIEIIIMIRIFKERNYFGEQGDSKPSKTAFDFACDEIIKLYRSIGMSYMRGAITHEESQTVMAAFNRLPDHHFLCIDQCLDSIGLDFVGMHPDCTKLTNAGIRWLSSKKEREGYTYSVEWSKFNGYDTWINLTRWEEMEGACDHFKKCYKYLLKVGKGYIENPRMHPYAAKIIGIPSTQVIHPYYFGSPQMKETHIWIVGLPKLVPDNILVKPKKKENYKEWLAWQDCWMASPGPKRAELRSKTDPNIARAFAEQWG